MGPDDKGRGATLGQQFVVVIVAKSGFFDRLGDVNDRTSRHSIHDGITLYDVQFRPDECCTEQASLAPFPVCRCNRASTDG
jgi:hypothetical protein